MSALARFSRPVVLILLLFFFVVVYVEHGTASRSSEKHIARETFRSKLGLSAVTFLDTSPWTVTGQIIIPEIYTVSTNREKSFQAAPFTASTADYPSLPRTTPVHRGQV